MNLHEIKGTLVESERVLNWLNNKRWQNQFEFKFEDTALWERRMDMPNGWSRGNYEYWLRAWIDANRP